MTFDVLDGMLLMLPLPRVVPSDAAGPREPLAARCCLLFAQCTMVMQVTGDLRSAEKYARCCLSLVQRTKEGCEASQGAQHLQHRCTNCSLVASAAEEMSRRHDTCFERLNTSACNNHRLLAVVGDGLLTCTTVWSAC